MSDSTPRSNAYCQMFCSLPGSACLGTKSLSLSWQFSGSGIIGDYKTISRSLKFLSFLTCPNLIKHLQIIPFPLFTVTQRCVAFSPTYFNYQHLCTGIRAYDCFTDLITQGFQKIITKLLYLNLESTGLETYSLIPSFFNLDGIRTHVRRQLTNLYWFPVPAST